MKIKVDKEGKAVIDQLLGCAMKTLDPVNLGGLYAIQKSVELIPEETPDDVEGSVVNDCK